MPELIRKRVADLTGDEMKRLKSLTMRGGGCMSEEVSTQRALARHKTQYGSPVFGPRKERAEKAEAIIVAEAERVLGWALLFYDGYNPAPNLYFYVRKANRRQGVGKQIMNEVRRDTAVRVHPWEQVSESFFGTNKRGAKLRKLPAKRKV